MIELREHQKIAVKRGDEIPHLALFHEAGTGKTGTLITILRNEFNRRRGIVNTLIFAPLGVCAQWKDEFAKFSKVPSENILILTEKGTDRANHLAAARKRGPLIAVTNYEGVQIEAFYKELLAFSPQILVLDEAHRLKDAASKRSKRIYPLARGANRRFILTGTPILNSLLDIFGQYKILDPTVFGDGYWSFRSKYFFNRNSHKKFAYPDWVPFEFAAKEIAEKMARTSVRATRNECLDLPPLQNISIPFQLSKVQERAYREMKKEFITEVNGLVTSSDFAMTKTLRMQQILAGFVQPDEKEEATFFEDQPRLRALIDLFDGIGKDQAIIWTVFKPTYSLIGKALEKEQITHGFLTGEQSEKEKKEVIAKFKAGEIQVIVANPAAASEGHNLQEARYAIYYMRGYNLLHYLQSLARNYRSGTELLHDKIVHYHIYARGTLDQVISEALLKKENLAQTVYDWAKNNTLDSI